MLKEKIGFIKNKIKTILNSKKRITIFIITLLIAGFVVWKIFGNSSQTPQYQTAVAERETLVVSISASGQVSSTNNNTITTQASGTISNVYVKDGDSVTAGDKIADIIPDQDSLQRQSSAYASYLSAQNSLNSAKSKMNSLQSALFVANQKFVTDRGIINPSDQQKADPVYIEENATWLQAEADYKNQQGVINQAQASLTSAWLSYTQTSSTITAPTSGTIKNLSISKGTAISNTSTTGSSSSNSTNSTNTTSQTIGMISTEGNPIITVNLSEIDVTSIKLGQKATITLDAFPNQTFTGKLTGIDTSGAVSSGVTTYPADILLDAGLSNIYPNMSATASIIVNMRDNVLLVPSAAVQTSGGQSTVRVMKNGVVSQAQVEVGVSSDTQTEITSGLSEGDSVVTSVITSLPTSGVSSPFSGTRGLGGLGGGGGFSGGGGGGGNRTGGGAARGN